jgi:hydrogenase maturation protease
MAAGVIVRTQEPLECCITVSAERLRDDLVRISVQISNTSEFAGSTRDAALARSLLSAHTILRLHDGQFVSLLDPEAEFQPAAAACRNTGTWPVLAGEDGARDTMLSSPIILYDYPQIAPQSPGDLCDGAEIDEILSLRILTLTDDEKQAMRRSDDRARRILERTETLSPEHFMKLHGVLRHLDPAGKEAS